MNIPKPNCPKCGRFIQKIPFEPKHYICNNCDLIWTPLRKWESIEQYDRYLDRIYDKLSIRSK